MLLLKLFLAWQLQLFGDEAFYAWEAAKPALAYSDLPGMTAWLIRLGIEVGGYSPFAARSVYILIGAAIPFLIVRIARQFSDDVQAWQAGILSCCLPLMLPIGFLALPDALLCLAALLCLDAALRLLQKSSALDCFQLAVGLLIG
ncbi:MAG: glycosyltransferase family 39 protein, partial [Arenimonas sp.]